MCISAVHLVAKNAIAFSRTLTSGPRHLSRKITRAKKRRVQSQHDVEIGDEHYTTNFHPMSMVVITDHSSHSVFQFYAPYIHIG